MGAIYILWLRELKRYVRSRVQLVVSLGQPALYLVALGFGFGPVFQKAGNGNYLQFMAPGVIGMTVLFSSVFSGIAMLWDRQFGFLKETLVAPVSRLTVMFGRTLGRATVAMIQGTLFLLVCLIAGFRPQHWLAIPAAFIFVGMIALVFAALGTTIGSLIKDMQGFQLVSLSNHSRRSADLPAGSTRSRSTRNRTPSIPTPGGTKTRGTEWESKTNNGSAPMGANIKS